MWILVAPFGIFLLQDGLWMWRISRKLVLTESQRWFSPCASFSINQAKHMFSWWGWILLCRAPFKPWQYSSDTDVMRIKGFFLYLNHTKLDQHMITTQVWPKKQGRQYVYQPPGMHYPACQRRWITKPVCMIPRKQLTCWASFVQAICGSEPDQYVMTRTTDHSSLNRW